MLADSIRLSEGEFESKYLAEIANLKNRAKGKSYSAEDGDDYDESFSNSLVGVLGLLNPLHLYDLRQ